MMHLRIEHQAAHVDLHQLTARVSPLEVSPHGSLFKNLVEANSTVTLQNLDLVGLSPYSSKFIAYPVTKGQLDWDMKVNTQASKLTMGNAITARQLQLLLLGIMEVPFRFARG